MDIAGNVFLPGQQYLEQEKQRLEHTYVLEGTHQPGCGPVDLGSGRIVIALEDQHAVLPARPKTADEADADGPDDDGLPD
ncbi:hypothetical protein H181DRAFT_02979 [Streptomyces sp. WMMB 714]|uniref:Uncharacterized protein n=1 Tax=Streptomyces daqingensis TaxID=1472640 RepID=A0ABQ2M8D2_9ACTN|nr:MULTISPECIES: DUF6191 domain-containing protein [Streptomyces]GGO48304.1 hypothetical protein GCM10012287_22990 [Streptomyces daqingensis]SCK35853.1 hypothetical protein H181DRAFT_02979 [Streptomyces sp. WMMB 714]